MERNDEARNVIAGSRLSRGHAPAARRRTHSLLLLLLLHLRRGNGQHSARLHDDFLRRQRVLLSGRTQALNEGVGNDLSHSLRGEHVPEAVRRQHHYVVFIWSEKQGESEKRFLREETD